MVDILLRENISSLKEFWSDHKSYILKLTELFCCLIVTMLLTLASTTYPDDCL